MTNQPEGIATPDRRRVLGALEALHERYRGCNEGRIASYIPELSKADPSCFAIAIVTVAGEVFEVGDRQATFTIQSLSKPFTHALALADRGRGHVMQRVGVEPSGDSFDSIIRLDSTNRPHNPMVNSGAIAVTSMIAGSSPADRFERILGMLGRAMGRRPSIDEAVFQSERATGHRNRAMAYLMLNFGILDRDVEEILDLYFRQCSVLVTAGDMATMAATLANGGVNPRTSERAVETEHIRDVLTVMHTCGMYNYAGEWAYTVGLPAKSGVSGGIIAVVPGQFGICVYSPRVDERGASVRGIKIFEDLSRNCGMHVFETWRQQGQVLNHLDEVRRPAPALPDTTHPQGDATVHKRDNALG
ncbi:MAG: glutaminase A [Phycisphaeraceae bacterium]|nr:glutaminase A [Phycisphaeraceae bacterium]